MERVLWIYMPFLLGTLFTITGYVTGFPVNSTDIVTDLIEVQSTTANVSESSTAQPLLQYSVTNLPKVPTSLPNENGDALHQTGNATSLPLTLTPISAPVATTTTSPATTTTPTPTTTSIPATTATPMPVVTISEAIATLPHTVSPVHLTTKVVTTALPTTTTLHPATTALTSTTLHTTTQPTTIKTTATQPFTPVHETTLQVAITPTASTPQEASTTASKSTNIPDNQTTKESGDWSIIGITSNSFTGKILLPIAVGGALSVVIIAVAYCYCSRRGSQAGSAKSSRNGVQVHRMTSNDRVMLLADSSEDEF
eukprot:XP_011676875.1 PREDICTED: mucin-1 [Strongylocentrotus purpuratus]